VRVADISLTANYRTEFANIVRDSGIDGLIKALTAKNAGQPADKPAARRPLPRPAPEAPASEMKKEAMIRREGERLLVDGPVTLANVAQVLEIGYAAIRDGAGTVDLAGVTELDSSLLAMLLAWMREAAQAGRALRLDNLPGA
jgi:phospholipid transport system transporter-binding protein